MQLQLLISLYSPIKYSSYAHRNCHLVFQLLAAFETLYLVYEADLNCSGTVEEIEFIHMQSERLGMKT